MQIWDKVRVEYPRCHPQYGFWEWDWYDGIICGVTRKGNVKVSRCSGLIFDIFNPRTGKCVNHQYNKHVPENFQRARIEPLDNPRNA